MKLKPITTAVLLSAALNVHADPATDLEGKAGYDRRAAISELADTAWQQQRFTLNKGLELLHGMIGTDRYYATRTLLGENRHQWNLLPNRLTAAELDQLLAQLGNQRADIVQLLADQGIPAGYLSVDEVESLLAPLATRDYDQSLRALLGSNKMKRSYSLPHFSTEEVVKLLQPSENRTALIRFMADRAQLPKAMRVFDANAILSQQRWMDRHDSIKALLGFNRPKGYYLQLPLTFDDTERLLHGVALRSEMIRYFADHMVYGESLTAERAARLLEGVNHTDRFNAIKSLLGDNLQQYNYIPLPLSAVDIVQLLNGSAYRGEMILLMADRNMIAGELTTADAVQILGSLRNSARKDAVLALLGNNGVDKGYLQQPLSASQADALIEGSAYHESIIQWLTDQRQLSPVSASESITLLKGMVGDQRYYAITALLGQNSAETNYLKAPLTVSEAATLFGRSANRLELIDTVIRQQMIQLPLNPDEQSLLLGRLYGNERKLAASWLGTTPHK